MTRRAAVAVAAAALLCAGCAEMVRWPDRVERKSPSRYDREAAQGHYVVKPGDTMYSIAFRHQLDFNDLAVWNDVGPDYLIRPGQVLRLTPPAGGSGPVAGSGIQTYPIGRPTPLPPAGGAPPPAPRPAPSVDPPARPYTWQWPATGELLRGFSEGGKGLDIGGEIGAPVVAAAPGKVVYSGAALKGYGELIIIKHDERYLSAYAYNRRRLVAEGELVSAGQRIAELGIGPEQKPLLHFEIREKGKPVNPAPLLPPR